MDRSTDQIDDAAESLDDLASDVRAEREALLVEQAEWERVRTQVEAGLADLERRLLEQVERLRAPRDAEEFRVALQEQLALAVERTEASEAKQAEMQAERDELVAELALISDEDSTTLREERDELRRQLDEALADAAVVAHGSANEASELRDRLAEAESEIATLRAQVSARGDSDATALAEARRQRDEAESRLEEASDRLLAIAGADGELAKTRRERDVLTADLKAEREQNKQREAENQSLRDEAKALTAERDALQEAAAEVETERDTLLAAAKQHDLEREELAEQLVEAEKAGKAVAEVESERDELASQNEGLRADADRLREEAEQLRDEADRHRQETDQLRGEVDRHRQETDRLREEADGLREEATGLREEVDKGVAEANRKLESERARTTELREKLAVAEQASPEIDRLRDELEEAQKSLGKQRDRVARLEGELSAWAANGEPDSGEADELRRERDELRERLASAEAAPAPASVDDPARAELQEKFDLALADLQSHRDYIAALEEQLATRPKSGGADPEELTRLREERDELQHRLDEAQSQSHADTPEDVEDLRARFEMAVEDVRRLKTENADLQQQVEASGGVVDNGWEAQKRRLLASLADEGESVEEDRKEDRATIQGTIQITDKVVADKDREIEKLLAQLAEVGVAEPAPNSEEVQALLDEDAIIQQERERLANLETDLRDKLRAVELELSVERAKISRAQAEIDEQQLELETLRAATSLAEEAADGAAPKRRWLDKLGLGGEGQ